MSVNVIRTQLAGGRRRGVGNTRCNGIRPGYILLLVGVDLGEDDMARTGQLTGKLFVGWGDGFAGTTPIRVDYSSC